MKTTINLLAGIFFLINTCFAVTPDYKLLVSNLNYTSAKSLEFDIILSKTSDTKNNTSYSAGQYVLEVNPEFMKEGKFTYSILKSDLPKEFIPTNPSVEENFLRLAPNMPVTEHNPSVSKEGILIAKMKLETSEDEFSSEPIDIRWSDNSSKFRTIIVSFADGNLIELDNLEKLSGTFDKNSEGSSNNKTELPKEYSLSQNYPNPFNPSTVIQYSLTENQLTSLKIYDVTGREVSTLVNQIQTPGRYEVTFDGSNFASGVYFYKITSGNFSSVKRMFLIK